MRKGSFQIDFAIGMAFFLLAFAFVLYFVSGYVTTSKPFNEIQQKGVSAASVLLTPGIPSDWEITNNTIRVGITKDLYRIPVLVESDANITGWPIDLEINFERLTNRSQIRVTDLQGKTIPFYVQNLSGKISTAEVVFVTELKAGRNMFYIYFSSQSTSPTNLTGGLNITNGTDFAADCTKRINTSVNTFVLCKNSTESAKAGIRSLKANSQNIEIADQFAIDNPHNFGDANTSTSNFTLTALEEGPVFAKYKLNITQGSTNVNLYYKFFNGSPVWKVDVEWSGIAGNGSQIQINTKKVFDKKQDSSESSEQSIPDTLTFNTATYGMARNTTNGYALSTAIKSNVTTYKFGWMNSTYQQVPYLNSTSSSITADFFTIWHSYASGNITNASRLFNQPNVTVLPRETVQAVSTDKINKLGNLSYSVAKFSLDLGQDEFFLRISNSTTEFYSYGADAKKRNVYVTSVKKLMQRDSGEIEWVTVTLGVWR